MGSSLLCGLALAGSWSAGSAQSDRGSATSWTPPPAAARPAQPARFLALGDSYTIGEGVPTASRWPEQLVQLLRQRGFEVGRPDIVARTGWTVHDLEAALDASPPATARQGPYALVSLLIGVNDQYRGGSPEAYRRALAAMLRRALAFAGGRADHLVVLSIPDWSVTPFAAGSGREPADIAHEIQRFNQVNREEAKLAGARYVDVTPSSRQALVDPSLLAGDGLHPSAALHAEWARLALPAATAALSH